MQDFEKLGVFYLGREAENPQSLLLYDSRDLTTHAVCVGMTGSGKTGLSIGLLEEAAIDGIPAIVVDPKGDMTNLMLSFPDLTAEDFLPWIDAEEAARQNLSPEQFAAAEAEKWQKGMAAFGQDGERIRRMRETTDFALYTPGSQAGRPLSVLTMMACPAPAIRQDEEAHNDLVSGTASALMGLLGLDADPLNSREHILLATVIKEAWLKGEDLDLPVLIERIQKPAVSQIGVLGIEQFFPEKDRFQFALRFNNLLASPQFAAWMEGEPLDIDHLLFTPSGQPRLSILTISHLSDTERMFFVALLLNRLVAWMRTQAGTSSLRALFYMDEIFGFFPPVANPPSKQPLLTLLKQARAFGLGVVLTTQNPVDLDYKGLANMGTWFIGRLQTERDKARLLDGLEGAAVGAFNRQEMDRLLSGLKPRSFLMSNVHENEPVLFDTRFCLSYLAGPLTRNQIRDLTPGAASSEAVAASQPPVTAETPAEAGAAANAEPLIVPTAAQPTDLPLAAVEPPTAQTAPRPADVPVYFVPSRASAGTVYQPGLFGLVDVHFEDKRNQISLSREEHYATLLEDGLVPVRWENSLDPQSLTADLLVNEADAGTPFAPLPAAGEKKTSYTAWSRDLQDHVFRTSVLELFRNTKLNLLSGPDEDERSFVIRLQMETREKRDADLEALRRKYESQRTTLEERMRRAEQAIEREKEQAKDAKMQTMISLGSTIVGSFLGRKALSATTVSKAATTAKSASRSSRQASDVGRAEETMEAVAERVRALESQFAEDVEKLNEKYDTRAEAFENYELKPLKRDVQVRSLALVWLPYEVQADGTRRPAW